MTGARSRKLPQRLAAERADPALRERLPVRRGVERRRIDRRSEMPDARIQQVFGAIAVGGIVGESKMLVHVSIRDRRREKDESDRCDRVEPPPSRKKYSHEPPGLGNDWRRRMSDVHG